MHNENLFGVLESNSTKAFSVIKSARNSSAAQASYIRVGDNNIPRTKWLMDYLSPTFIYINDQVQCYHSQD